MGSYRWEWQVGKVTHAVALTVTIIVALTFTVTATVTLYMPMAMFPKSFVLTKCLSRALSECVSQRSLGAPLSALRSMVACPSVPMCFVGFICHLGGGGGALCRSLVERDQIGVCCNTYHFFAVIACNKKIVTRCIFLSR